MKNEYSIPDGKSQVKVPLGKLGIKRLIILKCILEA